MTSFASTVGTCSRGLIVGLLCCLLLSLAPPAAARWSSEFENAPDFDTEILSATSFDGQLILGGWFDKINGSLLRNVAAWDGSRWRAMADGLDDGVLDFAILDGQLIATGTFKYGDEIPRYVARWDGKQWRGFGPGPDRPAQAVAIHDGKLVVASWVPESATSPSALGEWNGARWRQLGDSLGGGVTSLVSKNGRLFAGGYFEDGVLELLDGTWVRVGDLSGPLLHLLDTPDGLVAAAQRLRREDREPEIPVALLKGATWVPLEGASITPKEVMALTLFDDRVVAVETSRTPANIYSWDGQDWQTLGSIPLGDVLAVCEHQSHLIACGRTTGAGRSRNTLLAWDGTEWKWPPGKNTVLPIGGPDAPVYALVANGNELIVAGAFDQVGDVSSEDVAAWSGSGWRAFAEPRGSSRVETNCSFMSETQSLVFWRGELFGGGRLMDHSAPRRREFIVARWNEKNWECVGGPADRRAIGSNIASALTIWNDTLIAAGEFESMDGVAFCGVAQLHETQWAPLGSTSLVGLGPVGSLSVNALCVYQDHLYCGGAFAVRDASDANAIPDRDDSRADDGEIRGVAVWNGMEWESVGGGVDHIVTALCVDGDRLLAGGRFSRAGLTITRNVAAWDGVAWTDLGDGLEGEVSALTVHRNQVVAAVSLSSNGRTSWALRLWDGGSWQPFPSNDTFDGKIRALCSFQGELYVGGDFGQVGDHSSPFLARWISD